MNSCLYEETINFFICENGSPFCYSLRDKEIKYINLFRTKHLRLFNNHALNDLKLCHSFITGDREMPIQEILFEGLH